ncbi:MAG: glycerophosphodiester phosphodiesterase, partial [Myxococcales bacterium]|nr:glycerophosphodiester phosphodiesterase [Myxococcales bacterium]
MLFSVALLALVRVAATRGAPAVRAHPFFAGSAGALQVVAHRGGMAEGPENTIEAFRRALASGADVIEMDVRASADGELVVIHDASVDRTTDGSGRVDAMPLSALRSLDAAYRFSPDGAATPLRGRGVRIPTLAEVLEALPSARVLAEMKSAEPS